MILSSNYFNEFVIVAFESLKDDWVVSYSVRYLFKFNICVYIIWPLKVAIKVTS